MPLPPPPADPATEAAADETMAGVEDAADGNPPDKEPAMDVDDAAVAEEEMAEG